MGAAAIHAGDKLRCSGCGHHRTVTDHWLGELGRRHFPKRRPMVLRDSDLQKFKCTSCGRKLLEIAPTQLPELAANKVPESTTRKLALAVIDQASELERELLFNWAQQLVAIRESQLPTTEKAKAAISITIDSKAIWPFLKTLGGEIKRLGWDERSVPARIGLGAAAFALLLPGKGAAGIAALGGAIGVPLWIVFGAGGAFAGVIIEEINKKKDLPSVEKVVEGEVIEKIVSGRKRP